MFKSEDYAQLPKETVGCACCGDTAYIVATQSDRYGFGLQTVVCNTCGLLYTNPRPTAAWFDEFYRLHYRLFYKSLPEPTQEFIDGSWVSGRHKRNIALLAQHVPATGSILDVGASEGTFLHLFRTRLTGWQVLGVEPSESFSQFAHTHYQLDKLRNDGLESLAEWESRSLDLITANHVLEHLLDPNFLFATAFRLLRPNGQLFIDVPDANAKLRGIETLHIGHVYHFSEQTLRAFFEKHGFEVQIVQRWPRRLPFTLQMIGRRRDSVTKNWQYPRADAARIARSFAYHSQDVPEYRVRMFLYRKIYKPLRKLVRRDS